MTLYSRSGFIVLALSTVGWTLPALGQAIPTPEHKKMGYFTGHWKLQGTVRSLPNAPAEPFTTKEDTEWLTGGFFLETHASMTTAAGETRSVRMMEYNVNDNVYTYNVYDSLGNHLMAAGHVQDNVWTWNSEESVNGLIVKGRYTVTVVSPAAYNFKYETLTNTGAWATIMEGTATISP
jgi:Protein of unknown function (DUF1579)